MQELTIDELRKRAEHYCAVEEKCCQSVRAKLMQWGADKAEAEEVVAYLIEERFIDERRYAESFCQSKVRHQHWGRRKIAFELRQKQIPAEVIAEAMATVGNDEYAEVMLSVAEAKWATLAGEHEVRLQKLRAFLAQRGFEMEAIMKIDFPDGR